MFLQVLKANVRKLRYIYRLIVQTPYFVWIIVLQIISGFASILGLPMLIPVIKYMNSDVSKEHSGNYSELFDKMFSILGIEPSFNCLLIVAFSLIVGGQVLIFMSSIVANFSQQNLAAGYRKRIYEGYSSADWRWLSREKSGEMYHAILREADGASVAHLNSQRIVIYLLQVVVFLFIVCRLSFLATLLAIVIYGSLFGINLVNSKYVARLSHSFNEMFKKLANATGGLLDNKKFFKSSLVHGPFIQKLFNYINETVRFRKRTILMEQLQTLCNLITTATFVVVLIWFRNTLSLDSSELLIVIFVFMRLGPYFTALFTAYLNLNTQIPMHLSIGKRLIDLEKNTETFGDKEFGCDKTIRFNNVSFKYPEGERVIKDISLSIKPFHCAAFVGSSGAGKSTILDLVLCLLKPDSGAIYFGDIPQDQLDTKKYRKNVAYVCQETTLLDGTLLENLIIGNPDASDDEIEDVLKQINLDSLITTLPDGILTEIGENGIKLSGGQRQRVVLGRALIMKPRILIMDEATSELDTESEYLIQEAIKEFRQDTTIIMVAHRLSTVRFSDIIYVVENGSICEAGKYEELLERKGRLHYLDSLQKDGSVT